MEEKKVPSTLFDEHVQRPRNCGPLERATHVGRFGNRGDGPYMTLWFVIEDGRITQGSYQTYGCPSAIACASVTVELMKGRTVHEALRLTADDLIVILGGLPEGKGECAHVAVSSLRDALANMEDRTNA